MRRAWLDMFSRHLGLRSPRYIIVWFTILFLFVFWLKSSGIRRWLYYGFIALFSTTYSTIDVLFFSSNADISLARWIVPWVLWTLVMSFLFWREFWPKRRQDRPEQAHPAYPAGTLKKA